MLAAELSRRGLCKELKLRPRAAVTGTTLPEVRTSKRVDTAAALASGSTARTPLSQP